MKHNATKQVSTDQRTEQHLSGKRKRQKNHKQTQDSIYTPYRCRILNSMMQDKILTMHPKARAITLADNLHPWKAVYDFIRLYYKREEEHLLNVERINKLEEALAEKKESCQQMIESNERLSDTLERKAQKQKEVRSDAVEVLLIRTPPEKWIERIAEATNILFSAIGVVSVDKVKPSILQLLELQDFFKTLYLKDIPQ